MFVACLCGSDELFTGWGCSAWPSLGRQRLEGKGVFDRLSASIIWADWGQILENLWQ